jgi:hypothetical protein
MKKSIVLLFASLIYLQFTYAQKKSYVSIESGVTFSGMSNQIANNMKADGLDDNFTFDFFSFLGIENTGLIIKSSYPEKSQQTGNYKIRYGYNIKNNASIEAGFGRTYRSTVTGAAGSGDFVNYLAVSSKLSTAYVAYLWKNKKDNAAIGIGPAISICSIKQSSEFSANLLSDKTYVLPGAIFTGYWNFVNKKSWFMGLRTDMTITTPAKTEEVKIINPDNKGFVSISESASVGAVINTVSISAGIKF